MTRMRALLQVGVALLATCPVTIAGLKSAAQIAIPGGYSAVFLSQTLTEMVGQRIRAHSAPTERWRHR